MARIDQINELLMNELSNLINREGILQDGLITISYVETSPDLNRTEVGVTVLPDNKTGTALRKLRSNSSSFAGMLKKKLNLKTIPKFKWVFDATEREAAKLEDVFKIINEEE